MDFSEESIATLALEAELDDDDVSFYVPLARREAKHDF